MSDKLPPLEQQTQQLREQLKYIEGLVVNVSMRLDALQAELKKSGASIPAQPAPSIVEPAPAHVPPPAPTATPSPAPLFPARVESKQKSREWEAIIGGNWFNKIGIAAIILGIAFFLRYAIENDWINNTGKVLLGVATGLAFIAAGERFQNKMLKVFARGLTGGGAAILYLSLYFAFQVYQLISQSLAFGLMALVTAGMVALALRHTSRTILLFAMFGGFLTPFWVSTGAVRPVALFTYLAILDLGLVAVAWRNNWRFVNSLCFLATTALYAGWYSAHYEASQFWIGEIYLFVFYLIFAALAFLINLVQRKPAQVWDVLPILGSAFFFFLGNLALLDSIEASRYHSLLCAAMAVLYGGLSYVALQRMREDKLLALLLLGTATVFLTLFFPFEFEEEWLALSWFVEALVLMNLGRYLRLEPLQGLATAIWMLALLALAGQIIDAQEQTTPRHAYATFFTASICTLLTIAAQGWSKFKPEGMLAQLNRAFEIITLLLLPFLLLEYRTDLALLSLALVLLVFMRTPQITGYVPATAVLYYVPVAAVLVILHEFDPHWLPFANYRLILNPRFLSYCATALLLAYYITQKEKLAPYAVSPEGLRLLMMGSSIAIIVVLFAALTLETMAFYEFQEEQTGRNFYAPQQFVLSLVWSLYSLTLLGLGIWKRMLPARLAALVLFALTLVKVLFVDFWLIEKFYRIISAIAFGAILVYVSYLYQRHREKIMAVVKGEE